MLPRPAAVLLLALASTPLVAIQPRPQPRTLPQLGDPVPANILKAHTAALTSEVGDKHRDPCALIRIHH